MHGIDYKAKIQEIEMEKLILQLKIKEHAQIEKYFNWSVLLTIITIIIGVLNSPLLNP